VAGGPWRPVQRRWLEYVAVAEPHRSCGPRACRGGGLTDNHAGQSQTITVSLNGTGIKLLKSRHKLPVKLSVTSGGSPVVSQTIEFTQSKKKKKKKKKKKP
jgi:hypothetical protein